MMRKRVPGLLICSMGLLGPWGCAGTSVRPLTSALFVPASSPASEEYPVVSIARVAGDLQPPTNVGELPQKATVLPAAESTGPFADIKPIDALPVGPTTAPSAAVQNTDASPATPLTPSVISSDPVSVSVPDQPVVVSPHQGQGVYLTLGGVVAVVNDKPIFANEVLDPLNREFAIKAKDMEDKEFRSFASKEIGRQAEELIEDEVYFASAYHELSEEDRKLAAMLAIQNRDLRVTAAGGSVEQARRKAVEQGEDFDESLKKEYRITVISIYRHRHIEPLVQITADGMREYYRLNAATRYCDKDKAQFRVIEIDPVTAGGLQPAMDKIAGIREKAIHGADFTALASSVNDDSFLKRRGGSPTDPGEWLERNTYPNEAVEAAIWQIEPGQITPVIQADHVLYIAKLEAKHVGATKSFEDPAVQDDIYNKLRQTQLAARSQKAKEDSFDASIVDANDDRMQVALDIAMQKYAQATGR